LAPQKGRSRAFSRTWRSWEHTTLGAQSGEYSLDRSRCETRADAVVDCPVASATAFFRALLAESDPGVERFFLAAKWHEGRSFVGGMRGAFVLGRDGKVKIIVEVAEAVRELVALEFAAGRRDYVRFHGVGGSGRIYMADDPGDLKRREDGGLALLVFQDLEAAPLGQQQPFRNVADLVITPALEQRHKFFAALTGKPYKEPDPKSLVRTRETKIVRINPGTVADLGLRAARRVMQAAVPAPAMPAGQFADLPGGDLYGFRIGEDKYLVLSPGYREGMRFVLRRVGAETQIPPVWRGRSSTSVVDTAVMLFSVKGTLRGDEQLVLYHPDYGDEEYTVFGDFKALFEGL
jgi:hypothetical protein